MEAVFNVCEIFLFYEEGLGREINSVVVVTVKSTQEVFITSLFLGEFSFPSNWHFLLHIFFTMVRPTVKKQERDRHCDTAIVILYCTYFGDARKRVVYIDKKLQYLV